MIISVYIIILTLFIKLCMRYYRRYVIGQKIKNIPGPSTLPFIGNSHYIIGNPEYLWTFTRKLCKQFYPISQLWTPQWVVVNLTHPDDIEALLTNVNHINKSEVYNIIKPWLREGLLTSKGKQWHSRRKTLTPAFHFSVLQKYTESIVEHSKKLITSLQSENNEMIKVLEPWVTDFTLSVILETTMGVALHNLESDEAKKYKDAVNSMGAIAIYRMVRPWLLPDFIFSLSSTGRKQTEILKTLHNFSTNIINKRKDFHEKTQGKYLTNLNKSKDAKDIHDINTELGTIKLSMLDLLIEAYRNNEIDDIGIQEEVDTFIFEGYDTTAMALTYSLLLLAEHSEIQQRAREEINIIWKDCKGNIKITDIQKLSYIERCIKEALRLYPSVPFISRQLTEELHLKDHIIPPETMVNVHIYDVHRDPNYWPNPEVFDPDRFSSENTAGRHAFCYIPFSGGFRNCIGQKFAMLEMKSFIGLLLQHFKIEMIDKTSDIKHKTDLVIRSTNALRIKLVPIIETQKCI